MLGSRQYTVSALSVFTLILIFPPLCRPGAAVGQWGSGCAPRLNPPRWLTQGHSTIHTSRAKNKSCLSGFPAQFMLLTARSPASLIAAGEQLSSELKTENSSKVHRAANKRAGAVSNPWPQRKLCVGTASQRLKRPCRCFSKYFGTSHISNIVHASSICRVSRHVSIILHYFYARICCLQFAVNTQLL